MASRKRGNGKVEDITVQILSDIRDEIRELRDAQRLTNARLETLERATVTGFAELRVRFDHLLEFAGDRYNDHEQRIRALEQRAGGGAGPAR
jgi:hypothetical protein